jgi:hypothetical protein
MMGMDGLTVSLEDSEVGILLVLYRLFNEKGDWPTFDQLEFDLEREGLENPWVALRGLPHGLVSGSDFSTPPGDQQQLSLTINGLAAVSQRNGEAAIDFRVFCGTVVWAAREAVETRPPEAAHIQGNELNRLIEIPAAGRSAVVTRVGKLWAVNGHLWTQMSGVGDSWSAVLNRKGLRPYKEVDDDVQFIAAERGRLAQLLEDRLAFVAPNRATAESRATVPEVTAATDSALHSWFPLLPERLATELRSRLQSGHPEDALVHGWKTLSAVLSAYSGLELDGYDLVNQTFRSVDLAGRSQAEKNEHSGYVDILRGLARIRNVHAHPGAKPLSDLEAAAFLLGVGACMEWVESLSRDAPHSPAT